MPNEARCAILILGMHRSGTSAVAGSAVRLGAAGNQFAAWRQQAVPPDVRVVWPRPV
jgi:hypothetical protein